MGLILGHREKEKRSNLLTANLLERLFCGENRIRTCEPVLPATRFPGVPLQPLEHLSNGVDLIIACKGSDYF